MPEPELNFGHLNYSIVNHQTGELIASCNTNTPHPYLAMNSGFRLNDEYYISVISQNRVIQSWELLHDRDGYLRKIGELSEEEWLRRGQIAARCLIRLGANPEDKVEYDHKLITTLGGLAWHLRTLD